MAETQPAAEASGFGEAPWPVLSKPEGPPPDQSGEGGGGWDRNTVLRLAALIGLLAVVTGAGIAIGLAVQPAHHTATRAAAATTHAVTRPRPPVVHTMKWGPLTVRQYGTLPPGPPNAAAAVVGRKLAVVGGAGTGLVLVGPLGGKLVSVARLSRPRASAQAFAADGNLYVLGGQQGGKPSADVLRIDLSTGRGRRVSKFVEPLAEAGVATRGNTVYLVGGWTGQKYATAILKLTLPHKESLVARLPEGVRSAAVTRLGHTLYVVGGRTEHGLSKKVYAVDLDSRSVTALGTLPHPVAGAVLVSFGGSLYLLGGTGVDGRPSTAVVRIDPATGRPAVVGRMPKPLAGAAAVPAGSATLVIDPQAGAVYRIG